MITNKYKICVNGRELPDTYTSKRVAEYLAAEMAEQHESVSVCCISEYSADDITPLAARTYFHVFRRHHNFGTRTDFGGDFDHI